MAMDVIMKGARMQSPNGDWWRVGVTDEGTLDIQKLPLTEEEIEAEEAPKTKCTSLLKKVKTRAREFLLRVLG